VCDLLTSYLPDGNYDARETAWDGGGGRYARDPGGSRPAAAQVLIQ
jgi:hypothetical protein